MSILGINLLDLPRYHKTAMRLRVCIAIVCSAPRSILSRRAIPEMYGLPHHGALLLPGCWLQNASTRLCHRRWRFVRIAGGWVGSPP
jgi:hypothetical protein